LAFLVLENLPTLQSWQKKLLLLAVLCTATFLFVVHGAAGDHGHDTGEKRGDLGDQSSHSENSFRCNGSALHALTEQTGQQPHRDTHQRDSDNAQNEQIITDNGGGQSGHHTHDTTKESGDGSDQSSHAKTSLLSFDTENSEKQRDHKNT